MGQLQATAQDPKKITVGAAKVLYSTDSGSTFNNLGLARGVTFTENVTPLDVQADNGTVPDKLAGIAEQTANVTGEFLELDLAKMQALRGGVDAVVNTAGTSPVSGATQVVASGNWSFDAGILLEGQNGDGTAPTINSVTGSVDGAGAADDYDLTKVGGQWYLVPLDGTDFTTESQDLTIDYNYTPNASVKFTTGGGSAITRRWIRLINVQAGEADAADAAANSGISEGDAIFRRTTYDFYYSSINAGMSQTFQDKDATDPVVVTPFDMLAEADPSRSVKDQLYSITQDVVLQSAYTI